MWTVEEQAELHPVFDSRVSHLQPLGGKRVLVLCSAGGEVASLIAGQVDDGWVVGLGAEGGLA